MGFALGFAVFIALFTLSVLSKAKSYTDSQIANMEITYRSKLQENISLIQKRVYDEHMAGKSEGFEYKPGGNPNDMVD